VVWFYLVTFKCNVLLTKVKKYTQIIHGIILASNSYIFQIFKYSELHNLKLNLCIKQYNNFLHLIVAPQVSGGLQHNYSPKTRQAAHANEQSMYSLMSMI